MRTVFAILLLALFGYIELYNGFVWIGYEINKSEIIRKYCVNTDKPEMKCNGKCHMKKMMLQEDDKEESQVPGTLLPEIRLFVSEVSVDLEPEPTEKNPEAGFYQNLYSFRFYSEFDIPPKA